MTDDTEWRSMESEPDKACRVLLWVPSEIHGWNHDYSYQVGSYDPNIGWKQQGTGHDWRELEPDERPKAWMPLPQPPKEAP